MCNLLAGPFQPSALTTLVTDTETTISTALKADPNNNIGAAADVDQFFNTLRQYMTDRWTNVNAQLACAGGDFDGDGIPDAGDSCPTVVNTGSDSETDPQLALCCTGVGTPYSFCTGPGTTTAGDGVDAACDTCPDRLNPVIAAPAGALNRTRVSGQLDDDGDGFGNRCDFDHDQTGLFISPSDFAQATKTAGDVFPSVGGSNCGLNLDPVFAMLPCGVFDHDSIGLLPSPLDFALDVEQQGGGLVQNGPSCGAACTPPFGGAIGSGTEIFGKAICDGPRC